ncbi:centriole and centriolar satellite protein ofd1-like isoform X2 [Dysidea avara]|uniref:centriole and centriolar satellite protein ofd1-like isoform X2 n=1 Tax=Dysidea avara TaxID=196820 RepID=UPI00331D3887
MSQNLKSSELKSQLYHSLQQKGVLDAMKLQLRNRLVKELEHTPTVPKSLSVLESLTHGIILEHLYKMGYEYTISLFALESGMGTNQTVNITELLKLLNISPSHPLHKALTDDSQTSEQGFLATLLLSLPLLATHSNNTVDVCTQVDPTPEDSITQMKHQAHVSLEQRILAFERESEERTRKMMEERVSQFKATELLRVKMETKEMLQKEFQRKRNEVEQNYREKLQQLSKKEQEMIQRLQRREEELEASLYSQRQLVLQELELIRQREDHLAKQSELTKLQSSDIHSTSERLKQEEQILRSEVQRKQQLLDELQQQLDARTTETTKLRQQYETLWNECASVKNDLIGSKEQVHTVTEQMVTLQNQKSLLEQKLRESEDCDQLKADNKRLKSNLTETKRKLSEHSTSSGQLIADQQQLINELKDQLNKSATQLASLQQQLDDANVECKQAVMLKDLHIKRLEHQLAAQVAINERMLTQEKLNTSHWQQDSFVSNHHLHHDHHPHQTSRSILKSPASKLRKSAHHGSRATKPAKLVHPVHAGTEDDSLTYAGTKLKDMSSFDKASKKFLEEMKATFSRLEREAKELEEQHPTVGYYPPFPAHSYPSSFQSQTFPTPGISTLPSNFTSVPATASLMLGNLPMSYSGPLYSAVTSSGLLSTSSALLNAGSFVSKSSGTGSSTSGYSLKSALPLSGVNYPPVNVTHSLIGVTHPSTSIAHFPTSVVHPLTSVPHPLTSVPHPLTSVAHPLTNVPHPLTSVAHPVTSVPHPLTNVAHPLTSVSHSLTSVTHPSTTITHSLTSVAHPLTSVPHLLTSIPHPLTSVTHSLTSIAPPLTGVTYPSTSVMTSIAHPFTRDTSFTTITMLTTSPLSAVTYTLATTLSHNVLDTSYHHSSSNTLTSPSHNNTTQPNMSTTIIQEDSLTTRDRGDDNIDTSSSTDVKESPKSSGEGTLAAVLALRDQYSPSSARKQPAKPTVISLDRMWGGSSSKVQEETDKGEADEITHHSEKVVTTPPTQSMDNTMGKYLQLLQQTEDKSPPTTRNTLQEEESAVTFNTSDDGGKVSDDGFEDW